MGEIYVFFSAVGCNVWSSWFEILRKQTSKTHHLSFVQWGGWWHFILLKRCFKNSSQKESLKEAWFRADHTLLLICYFLTLDTHFIRWSLVLELPDLNKHEYAHEYCAKNTILWSGRRKTWTIWIVFFLLMWLIFLRKLPLVVQTVSKYLKLPYKKKKVINFFNYFSF